MKKIELVLKKITGVVSIISFVGIFAIMILTVCDIFLRQTVNKSILGCYELVQVMLLSVIFASFAYTQTEKGHVSVSLIISRFPRKLQMVCYCITGLLSSYIAVMLAYAALIQAGTALDSHYTTAVLLIPMYPFYYIEAGGMAVFFVSLLYDAVKGFIGIFNKEIADEIVSAWS